MEGMQSSWPRVSLRGASAVAALLALGFGMAAAIAPADASKVGVAAAVNPDAFSSLSGTPTNQLNIGKSIFFNERIKTTDSGLVQVLLVDGSTFTVGPGSDLVIDKFVYNPKKGTGEITTSFSKGVVRYVGGKISKNADAVKMKTPAGALAIRGGMFQAKINSGGKGIFSFLYGVGLTFNGKNGQVYKVFQPGYTLDLTSGTPKIRPTTAADTNLIMKAFAKGGSGTGTADTGSTSGTKPSTNGNTNQASNTISEIINTFTQSQLQAELQAEIDKLKNLQTDNTPPPEPGYIPPTIPDPECTVDCEPTPDPTPVNARVVLAAGELLIDQIRDLSALDGRLFGGLTDAEGAPQLNFPWFAPNQATEPCTNGICAVTGATITQGEETAALAGVGVFKPGFFAYQLTSLGSNSNGPPNVAEPSVEQPSGTGAQLLAFGGEGYTFASAGEGPGNLYKFDLVPDMSQPTAFGPFASAGASPTQYSVDPEDRIVLGFGSNDAGTGYISPLLLLDKNGGSNASGVWLQSSFFLGNGEEGELGAGDTFINVSLGNWTAANGLSGTTRSGGTFNRTIEASGPVGSLPGPDSDGNLSHFMGTDNPNIVVGNGASTHIGIGSSSIGPVQQPTGTQGPLSGFAAGFAQSSDGRPAFVANFSPSDVTLSFDASTNTMTSSFKLTQIDPSALGVIQTVLNQSPQFNLGFGGNAPSAVIDADTFAAIENQDGSSVSEKVRYGFLGLQTRTENYDFETMEGFVVSADAIKANEVLFAGQTVQTESGLRQKRAFCQDCQFMKWGAWGVQTTHVKNGDTVTTNVPLGWWIAGNVVDPSDIPTGGSATYTGDAIGTVATGGRQYVATGGMNSTWHFNKRLNTINITNFDRDKNFSALVAADGAKFRGAMSGPNGMIGAANGAFVGRVPNAAPQGMIGNFGVGNSSYQATGIFGGVR